MLAIPEATPIQVALLGLAAILTTNLDNIAIAAGSVATIGGRRTALALAAVVGGCIVLAWGFSHGLAPLPPRFERWAGMVPITLGLAELARRRRPAAARTSLSLTALVVGLASNSVDTLLVQTAALVDTEFPYDRWLVAGAATGGIAVAVVPAIAHRSRQARRWVFPALQRLQPWIMLTVGVFLLMDTPGDVQ